jgi:hypothetical protein
VPALPVQFYDGTILPNVYLAPFVKDVQLFIDSVHISSHNLKNVSGLLLTSRTEKEIAEV